MLSGRNHKNKLLKKAMELPNTLAIDIRNVGAQQANPVKKLGNMPSNPLYL